jgi:large subunit ribosomal protein L23
MKHERSVIKRLQATEKGTARATKHNQYFFEVDPEANKPEIKRAVEAIYGVKVDAVNTMHYQGKKRRIRTVRYGRCSDWKRAVVTLKEGSKIETAS